MFKSVVVWLFLFLATPAALADAKSECDEGNAPPDRLIVACSEIIQGDPKAAWAFIGRAHAYWMNGDNDRAFADLTEAINLDPKDAVAYHNRSIVYRTKGEYDPAITDANSSIERDPKYALAYDNRGNVHSDKGEYDLAMADFTKALELDPDFVPAYAHRADVYEKKGDLTAALADRMKVTTPQFQPKTAEDYNSRAWAFFKTGRAAEGLLDAMRSLELQPNYPHALDTRGHIFEALGRREEAISDFRLALSRNAGLQSSKDALLRLGATP